MQVFDVGRERGAERCNDGVVAFIRVLMDVIQEVVDKVGVIARPTHHRIGTRAGIEKIVPVTANQRVVAATADQRVVAGLSGEQACEINLPAQEVAAGITQYRAGIKGDIAFCQQCPAAEADEQEGGRIGMVEPVCKTQRVALSIVQDEITAVARRDEVGRVDARPKNQAVEDAGVRDRARTIAQIELKIPIAREPGFRVDDRAIRKYKTADWEWLSHGRVNRN